MYKPKYKDWVKIKKGFYEGQIGVVVNESFSLLDLFVKYYYVKLNTADGWLTIAIKSKNLEKVNK